MMMKLVMVDPSKSGKDKVRSNTFHHFKKTSVDTNKNSEKILVDNSRITHGSKPIVFHRFANDNNSPMVTVEQKFDKDDYGNNEKEVFIVKKPKNLVRGHTDTINISSRIKTQKKMMSRLDFMKNNTNDDDLVIKMDPRYNAGMDKNTSKYHVLKSQNSEFPHHEPIGNASSLSGFITNKNKIKKVTFINNINKLSDKSLDVISTSDQTQHDTESFPISMDSPVRSSKPLCTNNRFENLTIKKSKNSISMSSVNEDSEQNNLNGINKNEQIAGETNFTSKNRNVISNPQLKHPVMKYYLTYKFKVNVNDGKPENGQSNNGDQLAYQ